MFPANKNKNRRKVGSQSQFPGKLHDLFSYVETQGLESVISWVMNGRAFVIQDPEKLVELLPMFFSQTKYRSFRRQLNMWHFERMLDGPNRGAFHHPYFVRGNKSLCSYMSRNASLQPRVTIDSKDPYFTSQSTSLHLDLKNEMEISRQSNALDSTNLLEIYTSPKQVASHTESLEPIKTGDLQDGDLAFFAGRKFFFLDSRPSPCPTPPTTRVDAPMIFHTPSNAIDSLLNLEIEKLLGKQKHHLLKGAMEEPIHGTNNKSNNAENLALFPTTMSIIEPMDACDPQTFPSLVLAVCQ